MNTAQANQDFWTPRQLAQRTGRDPGTVMGWINSGQLRASNLGQGKKLPRWLISEVDFQAFLKANDNQRSLDSEQQESSNG